MRYIPTHLLQVLDLELNVDFSTLLYGTPFFLQISSPISNV